MNRYIIGSLWDRANRNGANKNFEYLFEGSKRIDALNSRADNILRKSDVTLNEAQQTNNMNKDVQRQLNNIILENGDSEAEVVQARGDFDVLNERLQSSDEEMSHKATKAETYSNITTPKSITLSSNNKRKAHISFVDDDGFVEYYNKTAPKLESKGLVGTVAIITSNVGKPGYMTVEQLQDLQSRGFEIASHFHEDSKFASTARNTPEEIEYQCKRSKELLNSWGLKADHLIYPGGVINADGVRIVKRYYKAGYTASDQNNDKQNSLIKNEFGIQRISADTGDFAHFKTQADRCKTEDNWLVVMTHVKTHTAEKTSALHQFIDYVSTLDVEVGTLSQGYDIFGSPLNVGHERYIKILNDGDIYSNAIGSVFKNPIDGYEINEHTPLSYFEPEKITYSLLRIEDGATFPGSNSGLLETFASGFLPGGSYQKWTVYRTERVFKREWYGTASAGSWGDWEEQVYKKSFSFDVPQTNLMTGESKTVEVDLTSFLGTDVVTNRIPNVVTHRANIVDGIMYNHRIEAGVLKISFYNPLDTSRNMYLNTWTITIFV